jgi:hypothetical protein
MNCDQVFDILTRGPFPSGDAADAAVERHLAACHECRRLAEALRPAVELFHESIGPDERGSAHLPLAASVEVAVAKSTGAVPDASPSAGETLASPSRLGRSWTTNLWRFAAAVALGAGLVLGLRGIGISDRLDEANPSNRPSQAAPATASADSVPSRPDAAGRQLLASFSLPAACFGIAEKVAAPRGETEYLCCTSCHAKSNERRPRVVASATIVQSCRACHP